MTAPKAMSAIEWLHHTYGHFNVQFSQKKAEAYAAYRSAFAVNDALEEAAQALEQFNILADNPNELAAIIRARKVRAMKPEEK